MPIPSIRIHQANEHDIRDDGDYVLYWMTASRRTRHNFALQHAIQRATELSKPLVVFEPLRLRYRWASDRFHRFLIEGMRDNAKDFADRPVTYLPYVQRSDRGGDPVLGRLAEPACAIITDEYPCEFYPRMIRLVKKRLNVSLELVDSNGVVPLRLADRTFTVAHSYRRWMQKQILDCLHETPLADPLEDLSLPEIARDDLPEIEAAEVQELLEPDGLSDLAIDHSVPPSQSYVGGSHEALSRLQEFIDERYESYATARNHPDEKATTGLSPYLHFGHIAAQEIVDAILDRESWTPDQVAEVNGKAHGFWNISQSGEALLDQVLTWREIGFNMAFREPEQYDQLDSLPDWAKKSIAKTADDERPVIYSLEEMESAETDDELFNAAQRQLKRDGIIHNYMRMLWGKKIYHWTASAEEALAVMIELNNKYALDGRDPNSYNGIFWVLGRYDRAWGPKRPVFGTLRYMTSDSARRKLRLKDYLSRFAAEN